MSIFRRILCKVSMHSGICNDGAFRCAHCDHVDWYGEPELWPDHPTNKSNWSVGLTFYSDAKVGNWHVKKSGEKIALVIKKEYADLICTSPELLIALEGLLNCNNSTNVHVCDDARKKALAAINKARGL